MSTRSERVRELERFALRRLPSMQLGDGVFCHELSAEDGGPEGRSLRNTLVVLLGLLRAEEHGLEHSLHLGALRSRVLSQLASGELGAGDLGLALWAESRSGGEAVGELVAALGARLDRNQIDALPSMEVAWIATGLTEAGTRGGLGPGEEVLAEARSQLLEKRRPRDGLVTHALRGRRRRLPHFGDQIYSVQALALLARIRDDGAARDGARAVGDLLVDNQMPNGAWPSLYDPARGTVVDPYELYSVHQGATAMIGMHGLTEATGEPRSREIAVQSLDWIYGGNELGAQMFDPGAEMIYRSIRRKPRFARAQQARSAAAAYLRAAPRLADPEELEVNNVMRPDQLGWLLEAWAGREHLAGGTE
ncbi:MAG: hypothetical protein ACRDKV_07040 [Solirubrobacterales bacterium]